MFTTAGVHSLRKAATDHVRAAADSKTTYGKEFSRLAYGLGENEFLQTVCKSNIFRKAIVELTGSPLLMADAQAFELEKGKTGFAWHYDSLSFRFIRPEDAGYSLWIPLDKICAESTGGGMAYVSESVLSAHMNFQLSNLLSTRLVSGQSISSISLPLASIFETPSLLTSLMEENKEEDSFEPGDAFFFRKTVWHRSSPLTTQAPSSRLAIVIRFLDWRSRFDKVMYEGEFDTGGGVGMGMDWGKPKQATYGSQFIDVEHGDEIRTSRFCGPLI
ncbi:phytanoyl-CoA dioxygenase family protein [Agrobacterium sp. LMR679]|uniref:phytanoyl-CoA dioxygenase family protein n=1 Tax=Agrobacterium sp. LMR679 TaxID=3014335 RepID=UPI0022AFD116|nr:phytanoyl-CoA dioxygenase family protein [Agrobacterium sp. LMR679]MCZ4072089.1 hypothetical protein [Agrobacterium sp. LMR679]